MDKRALERFATSSRIELIEKVKQKVKYYGFSQDEIVDLREVGDSHFVGDIMLNKVEGKAWRSLRSHIRSINTDNNHEKAFNNVIEEVAYTWFNRLVALRFMEVHNYLPTRVRVTSSIDGGADPDILREALNIDLEVDRDYVYNIKQNNKRDELYKYMIIKQCDALQEILPFLFDKTHYYVALLFPYNLLSDGGIISNMVNVMSEDDCDKVEIIGWLYQYYISDRKNEVFAALKKNKKIQKEDIAPATQLFTPEWIVRYMVQNSLGRLWIEHLKSEQENSGMTFPVTFPMTFGTDNNGKIEALQSKWKYYLEEAKQEDEVEKQLIEIRKESKNLKLEDIKILDPSMGSGHVLVYAFDLLYEIYEEQGYVQTEISKSIIENNLYGLDIDYRAAQLAYFAVMMKGRSKDARFFRREVKPNVYDIEQSNGLVNFEHNAGQLILLDTHKKTANHIISAFKNAMEYGSLVEVAPRDYDGLIKYLDELGQKGFDSLIEQSWYENIKERLPILIDLAKVLSTKYDVVCTNPPYMGSKGMNPRLSGFVKKNYPDSKSDLFAVFMERCKRMALKNGFYANIVQPSVLSLSSYEKLRSKIVNNDMFITLLDMGRGIFGIDFGSTSFVIRNTSILDYNGTFFKLHKRIFQFINPSDIDTLYCYAKDNILYDYNFDNYDTKQGITKEESSSKNNIKLKHEFNQANFTKIPGMPIAYWVSEKVTKLFNNKTLKDYGDTKKGVLSGDDKKFTRQWHEVNMKNIGFSNSNYQDMIKDNNKWIPVTSGGEYRNWYGNHEKVLNMGNDSYDIKYRNSHNYRLRDNFYYFKEALTWSEVSSKRISVRYVTSNILFGNSGPVCFFRKDINYFLGLLNSKVSMAILKFLSPTMTFGPEQIKKIPIISKKVNIVSKIVEKCINTSKQDWDSFETSWDFTIHPLLRFGISLNSGLVDYKNIYKSSAINIGIEKTDNSYKLFEKGKPDNGLLETSFNMWMEYTETQFNQLRSNDEKLNRIFIDIYDLEDELTPEVEDKDVTINRIVDDKSKYDKSNYLLEKSDVIKSFISYAVGCMLGRYSLYKEGLLYAGGDFDYYKVCDELAELDANSADMTMTGLYTPFMPDEDNVIPITDDNYFSDDIVGRLVDFVEVCYGREHLDENIEFIADSLKPKNGETPKETIRRYFLNDFFKDHVKRYKKRPIYWLFTSGKQKAFNALIYIHRYDKSTLARIRTDYLHRQQSILEAKKSRLIEALKTESNSREQMKLNKEIAIIDKQLDEMAAYDEILHHEADRMIEIDLDDGVVVNYAKFDGLVGKV